MATLSYVRLGLISPSLEVGNVKRNIEKIVTLTQESSTKGVDIVLFPELSLTGYTLGDFIHHETTTKEILEGITVLKKVSSTLSSIIVVGAPIFIDGSFFNMAIVIYKGSVVAMITKTHLPEYREFYEKRWFASATTLTRKEFIFLEETVPVGVDIICTSLHDERVKIGIEICEDLWVPIPPSSHLALQGATILLNLSASNELVGKHSYRKDLVVGQSARTMAIYAYVSSGVSESSTDLVFSGASIVAENGTLLVDGERFTSKDMITIADVDADFCNRERGKTTSFADNRLSNESSIRTVYLDKRFEGVTEESILFRPLNPHPFIPKDETKKKETLEEILSIQSSGLATRMRNTGITSIVLGLSGGLDSTLALLVALRALKELGLPTKNIHAFSFPGFGTTKTTKSNSEALAKITEISFKEISIIAGSETQLRDIEHVTVDDVTFENVQARYRTMTLFNKANTIPALVLGTGDLSEIALGWCTFGGDHLSHYNVNASVPKTLVKHLVTHIAESSDIALKKILLSIVATPISPELLSTKENTISQKTEDIIGPYELHDFFLYHLVRRSSTPNDILELAIRSYKNVYDKNTIKKWLTLFIKRFFGNQWKRSVAPDGPKVGSVSLSPRGDFRLPSDIKPSSWLRDLDA